MAIQSFQEAFEHDKQDFVIIIKDQDYHGFFANIRIDRDTLPDGWYAYDMRDGDSDGIPYELKNGYIVVNHLGTFYTQSKLPIEEGQSLWRGFDNEIDDEFEYCFSD
jgi:hypothetical protein